MRFLYAGFATAPQKGLKKDDGVRGRREKISSKFFPFFPDHKSTFVGNRAYFFSIFFNKNTCKMKFIR